MNDVWLKISQVINHPGGNPEGFVSLTETSG